MVSAGLGRPAWRPSAATTASSTTAYSTPNPGRPRT
jgi:hypothetical protein